MNLRTSKGAAKILFLLPALVVAAGLVYYMHHTGKIDLSVLRKWQVQATNFYNKTTSQPGETQEKIMTADLDELSGALTEAQINERFNGLALSCFSVKNPLGDYTCTTPISLFNETRARSVTFFFRGDRLTNMRVMFDADQQQELSARLQGKYGPSKSLGSTDPQTGRRLAGWKIPDGTVAISDVVSGDRDTLLLWMANTAPASGRK